MMKKVLIMIVAVLMVVTMTVSAIADEWTWYAKKSKVNYYEDKDLTLTPLGQLKGGQSVLVNNKEGDWTGVLIEAPGGNGQMLVWIRTEDLSSTMPPEFCKHQWSDWTINEDPTCSHKGSRTRVCDVCGKSDTEDIDKLPHTYGDWTVTKKATCTAEGERVRTCSVCKYEQKQTIDKEPHDYGKWKVTKEATCTQEGERYRVCNNCDYKQTQKVDKLPHEYGEWTILREPTCTEKGERKRTCKVCGYENRQDIDKLPHDYELRVLVETTDHSAGIRAKICRVCGHDGGQESFDPEGTVRRGSKDKQAVRNIQQLLADQGYLKSSGVDGSFGGGTEKALKQFQTDQGLIADGVAWPQTIKRLNHEFGPWQTIRKMTRTEPGERVRVCKDCGYQQVEIIESGATYARGSKGEDIRTIQKIINALGYNAGSADGVYGRKLDAAFASFAAARGFTVEEGKVRPGDVDALVNAWLGTSALSTSRNLSLVVVPASEADDNGIVTYSWSLTNLGSDSCTAYVILLNFGDVPDFRKNNLVVVVDGTELNANGKNSASGIFSVDPEWGEGTVNFAAIAVSKKDEDKRLSNIVAFSQKVAQPTEAKTIEPQPVNVNIKALADGVYPVAFSRDDIASVASGIYMNAVQVFVMDTYAKEDVDSLAVGDTIMVSGEACVVETVENRNGIVFVNGGMDAADGYEFITVDGGNDYRVFLYDDAATYTEQGTTTLAVAAAATYTDASDLSADPVTVGHDEIISAMQASENAYFDQYNTTVRIERGKVAEINRIYMP